MATLNSKMSSDCISLGLSTSKERLFLHYLFDLKYSLLLVFHPVLTEKLVVLMSTEIADYTKASKVLTSLATTGFSCRIPIRRDR